MTQGILLDVAPDMSAFWQARMEGSEAPSRAKPTEALPLFLVAPAIRPTSAESAERRAARIREVEAARAVKEAGRAAQG
jgi:hypothetical protein